MPYIIQYDKKHGLIMCDFNGVSIPEEGHPYVKEVVRVGLEHNCKLVLIDVRKCRLNFSTPDIYELPVTLDDAGLDRSWRRAIIARKQQKELFFYETVATNRGYSIKVFLDQDEAIKWLKE